MIEQNQLILMQYLMFAAAVLFTKQTVVLFLCGRNNRARRLLGYMLLMFALLYVVRAYNLFFNGYEVYLARFRSYGLIGTLVYIAMFLFYPIEVLLPGWLSMRKIFIVFMPLGISFIVFRLGLYILDEEMEVMYSLSDVVASISHFNVWFRMVFILLGVAYMIVLLYMVLRYKNKYMKWCSDNFSNLDNISIHWIDYYLISVSLIFVTWLFNVLIMNNWCVMVHTVNVICNLFYISYKAFYHENPYPENFFKEKEEILPAAELAVLSENDILTDEDIDPSFSLHLPAYVELVSQWMDTEKPFLQAAFQLTDVSRILPLNRSYLSRVFNEGFGNSFSEVVRKYRVEYAKHCLLENPDLPMYTIADMCGFTSASTFTRSFVREEGVTPMYYREYTPQGVEHNV